MKNLNGNNHNTIIFDLDGTLRESIPMGDRFLLDHAVSLGVRCEPECLVQVRQWGHRYWASSEDLLIDQETYGKGEPAFWENYARRTLENLGAPSHQVRELAPLLHQHMSEHYRPEDTIPEDVVPTLKKLRQAGFTLGVLTNRTDPVDDYMAKIGLAKHLDFYLAAGEIGVWKPDPGIFYYAMGVAGSRPQETVYIGDNYYADVVGAENVDITGVLIDREGIFPDIDCLRVDAIGELPDLVGVKEKKAKVE
ncbi:MAG TPA: HAD family hydrolase [Anaerolineales bacterium]|nr:HAD family hydrolase [Anaerolineales bacterium]